MELTLSRLITLFCKIFISNKLYPICTKGSHIIVSITNLNMSTWIKNFKIIFTNLILILIVGPSILQYRCKMTNKCVNELVGLLLYSRFTLTCFGKWLPSLGGRRCLRSYSYTGYDPSSVAGTTTGIPGALYHWNFRFYVVRKTWP
jgi:hypothetical protein